jgi:hypothetical protein
MSDPITDLKHELLAAAERQDRQDAVPAERRPVRTRVPRPRLLVTSAALAIAAGVALFVTAPWGGGSPDFLAKAQAALTPPAGTVLHEKWQDTVTSTDPACTATRVHEIWVEETLPHRYRALVDLPGLPGDSSLCTSAKTVEIGGTLDSRQTLRFVPPNTLSATGPTLQFPSDPVQMLRDALSAGKAVDEGQTRLDGRTVERIRIGDTSVYVDPQSFYPVEAYGPVVFQVPGRPAVVLQSVSHVLAYDYLPGTSANLALTNIQAQHPNATISR